MADDSPLAAIRWMPGGGRNPGDTPKLGPDPPLHFVAGQTKFIAVRRNMPPNGSFRPYYLCQHKDRLAFFV
jgi:hypothetical protein